MARRVVQWGTGVIGRRALELIIGHPELELTGLIVHDPKKAGCDAAELCGLAERTGIVATTDAAAALKTRPDLVSYMAIGTGGGDVDRSEAAVGDLARLLSTGMNVVSTSVTPLVYPPAAPPEWCKTIEDACAAGRTSCFVTGAHPGFLTDLLPLTVSGLAGRIDSLKVTELINYETWSKVGKLRQHFGFGMPKTYAPPVLASGVPMRIWGAVLVMLGDALGVIFDRIEERHDSWFTTTSLPTRGGPIDPGTLGAIHFGLHGVAGGRDVIVVDHVYRAHYDAAPAWPQPPGSGGYRIELKGDPSWTADFAMYGVTGAALDGGELATAVRAVNAIPAVCDAKPGLLTPLMLPTVTGRGLFRPPPQRV